jgi:hypothetical protein
MFLKLWSEAVIVWLQVLRRHLPAKREKNYKKGKPVSGPRPLINLELVAYVMGRINTVKMLLIPVIARIGCYHEQITKAALGFRLSP